MLDVVIAGGEIMDGSGAAALRADVGISEGRIAAVGDLTGADCRERVDARGRVVCPGFVDMHTHSDLTLLANPYAESAVHQGVTTHVVGNCGMGAAPVRPEMRAILRDAFSFLAADVEWPWNSLGDYLQRVEDSRPSINVGALVSHGALRAWVMGLDEREASPAEREAMGAAARHAMREGALGVSSGLIYKPGMYADLEELVCVARAAAEFGGLYATHMRSEGDGLLEAVAEALETARRSGARTEVCHLKASGARNWGRASEAAALIAEARDAGVDVAFDAYPYTAGSTMLLALLPQWLVAGTTEEMVARLRDPEAAAKAVQELRHGGPGFHSSLGSPPYPWDAVLITSVGSDRHRGVEGQHIARIAEEWGTSPEEAVLRLLADERGRVSMAVFSMCEQDVEYLLGHPLACLISDGLAFAPYGPLGRGRPHPRSYGTFPRFLGCYARDRGILPLAEAVRRATSEPSARSGIADRGLLREGLAADIVVFDPAALIDTATYADPHRYPEGIDVVFVNGQAVVRYGEHTGARPGKVLRHRGA